MLELVPAAAHYHLLYAPAQEEQNLLLPLWVSLVRILITMHLC